MDLVAAAKNYMGNWWKLLKKEIRSHISIYFLLILILLSAFFVRVYRLDQLLGFYFDQGRDALVIWKLLHGGKPFLIGPVTGLAGIFLGPFYYYLIAPFYLMGGGNPVFPAVFLAFLSTVAIGVIYYLGWKMQSRITGLIAVIIASFSYYLVLAGRWLANPTPIMLSSTILLLAMWKITNQSKFKSKSKKDLWWIVIALTVGVSLHFEAASAVFYLPMILAFYLWIIFVNAKKQSGAKLNHPQGGLSSHLPIFNKTIIIASLIFLITLLPQIAFNFRHENILFNNFRKVLIEEKSFRDPFGSENLVKKKEYFWSVFSSKIFPGYSESQRIFYTASLLGIIVALKKKSKTLTLFAIFLGVPMLFYIFFQGNFGNIYDYYMTGYYLPMILLFSIGLGSLWKNPFGKLVVVWFFIIFLNINGVLVRNNIRAGADGPTHVSLGNQMQAVNWIYDNAMIRGVDEFNIDTYVPPVIPYAYDYLYLWTGTSRCGKGLCGLIKDRSVSTLYSLFEQDPPHPERLEYWLIDENKSGIVEEEAKFGGIGVQRRKRF